MLENVIRGIVFMDKKNILIFPSNAVEIYQSLKYSIHFDAYGASGIHDHSKFIFPENKLIVSKHLYITDEKFFETFNGIINKWHIDFIIPSHDTIALFLMRNQDKINAKVICSPLKTTEIAENKQLTYEALKDTEYYSKVYSLNDEDIKYPVFLKPFVAAGAKGTVKVNNVEELKQNFEKRKDFLICEYLPGEEYTIDCFTDKTGKLLFAGARSRERITNGVTFLSRRIEMTPEMNFIANDLNSRFEFRGAWFFQVKADANGKLKLMEFSVRQAGTMSFYRQLGINFSLLSLFDFMDIPVKILFNDLNLKLDRGTQTLYDISYDYDTIYLDYDDTLVVNNRVNTDVIQLIYQAHNNSKKVCLLTKHIGDLEESFNQFFLSKKMFDEIIIIEPSKKKSDYIKHQKAIFIDNFFPERECVHSECGIPVFDVDAVECLIDKRGI